MVRETRLIPYLLVICIGFMPALNMAAGEMQHDGEMPANCLDCDPVAMAVELSCGNEDCQSTLHACGPGSSSGFIPVILSDLHNQTPRSINDLVAYSKFGSHSGDPLFRPPIA